MDSPLIFSLLYPDSVNFSRDWKGADCKGFEKIAFF